MDFQTFVTIIVSINLSVIVVILIAVDVKERYGKNRCDGCKAPLKKYPKYHKFDARHGGRYKDGETCKLCTKCLIKYLRKYLGDYEHYMAIIEPFKPFNAYESGDINDFINMYGKKKANIIFSRLIKQKGKCVKCGKETNLVLYPPEIYSKNPYDFNANTSIEGKHYCANCICQNLEKIIDREQIYFERVYPPRGESGVMSCYEA